MEENGGLFEDIIALSKALIEGLAAFIRLWQRGFVRSTLGITVLILASVGATNETVQNALGARIGAHTVELVSCGILASLLTYFVVRVLCSWEARRFVGDVGTAYHHLSCAVRDQVMLLNSFVSNDLHHGGQQGLPRASRKDLDIYKEAMDDIAAKICRIFDVVAGTKCAVHMFLIRPNPVAAQADIVAPVASTDKGFWKRIDPHYPLFGFSQLENCPFWYSNRPNEAGIRCFRTSDSRREPDHCTIPGYRSSAVSVLLCPIQTRSNGGLVGFLWISANKQNVFDGRHERYAAAVAAQLSPCCSPVLASTIKVVSTHPRQQGGWEV